MKCTCVQCGKTFELSDSEIEFYRKKNLHLPKRCKECRQKNKQKSSPNAADNLSSRNSHNSYNAPSNRKPDNKNGKWIYAVIVVAALLLILGIKVSRNFFDTYVDGYTYPEESTQSDFAGEIDSGQSESVNAVQSEQNNVANNGSADFAPDDSVNPVEPIQAENSDSAEPAASIVDTVDLETESKQESELKSESKQESGLEPESELKLETVQESELQPEPESDTADNIETTEQIQDNVTTFRQYSFRNAELLEEHYQKHGVEMGFSSSAEYQMAANAVVNNENSLHKLEAEDGDDVYYLEATNDFVIVSTDGYIRTYFRPDSRINYYNKQ
ncbi:MAG: zinc-ribbon domain containing protein [Clostridiales bacterium]|nr:zinc-ribbon domain containing protein [Clostridiales bacterium]